MPKKTENNIDLGDLPNWRRLAKPPVYSQYDAVLQIAGKADNKAPHNELINTVLTRRQNKGSVVLATLPEGTTISRCCYDVSKDSFSLLETLRKALTPLLALSPKTLLLDVRLPEVAATVLYATLVGAARLPGKKNNPPKISLAAAKADKDKALVIANTVASTNTLARALTQLPPNTLTPDAFVRTAKKLASEDGLEATVYTAAKLKQLAAGAILAVGQAATTPPAIVHLRYRPRATKRVTLVGKGICFDTGGVNVKPASYMRGMTKDMAGAAVALASVVGAARLKLPVGVDAWLALAENSVGPAAYRPDEIITALNGKRIEIVHTDAEGRMVLADTLTLASKKKSDLIISYATLTGTMHVALAERMSGFFCEAPAWRNRALAAAAVTGERLCHFPMPEDYKARLKSDIADIKQCAEKGEADHILAALFLRDFINTEQPAWCHLDLSSAACEGGLAAAPGPVTGFGVAWTLSLLQAYSE